MSKLLQTGPHVDRALTLLALIASSKNPVERDRYEGQLKALRSQHPEVHNVRDDDPRIEAFIADARKVFAGPAPGFYLKCGLHWTAIDFGSHGSILTCGSASPEHATRFDSWNYAAEAKQKVEAMPYAGIYEIVKVK